MTVGIQSDHISKSDSIINFINNQVVTRMINVLIITKIDHILLITNVLFNKIVPLF